MRRLYLDETACVRPVPNDPKCKQCTRAYPSKSHCNWTIYGATFIDGTIDKCTGFWERKQ